MGILKKEQLIAGYVNPLVKPVLEIRITVILVLMDTIRWEIAVLYVLLIFLNVMILIPLQNVNLD